ncbi:MAG: FkbM family methyltransferase [Pseudomonadota bacterium]
MLHTILKGVKYATAPLLEGAMLPVPFGPLRGQRMRYSRHNSLNVTLGRHELENFYLLSKLTKDRDLIPSNGAIADVGGNVGCYALWFARHAVPEGTVYSFEPNPAMARVIRDNLAANRVDNVVLEELVCADELGEVTFYLGWHHHVSSLDAEWAAGTKGGSTATTLPATTLDAYFDEAIHGRPDLVKIDIEGGGVWALPGMRRLFAEERVLGLIESHNPAEDRAISDIVMNLNYRALRVDTFAFVEKPEATFPDPDGITGTMLLVPQELANRVRRLLEN